MHRHPSINNKMHNKSNYMMRSFEVFLTKQFVCLACFVLFLTSQTAHADFRKALTAYQNRDGQAMLKEVQDAVDKKNDDGIILFLSMLKQYPQTWQPTLNETEKTEFLRLLEKAATRGSLQAQYRLAIIHRIENNPPPMPQGSDEVQAPWFEARKQEKLQEYRDAIARLEPVANKGYASAALHLYVNYAHNLTNSKTDHDNAIKWLKKSAELGSAEGQFVLGMKYLNVEEGYGCYSFEPNLCLPKDEAKGWYWMRQAAKRANERNTTFFELFCYEMGNLYLSGVAENKPNFDEAYRWYLIAARNEEYSFQGLGKMYGAGLLKTLNPELDAVWNDAEKRVKVLALTIKNAKHPKLFVNIGKSNKLKLPVFSYTYKGFYPNQSLDVYADGSVNLLISSPGMDLENNQERWIKISQREVNVFLKSISSLHLDKQASHRVSLCEQNCIDFSQHYIKTNSKTAKMNAVLYGYMFKPEYKYHHDPELPELLALVEANFPVRQLMCDADSGESKKQCEQVKQNILNATK